MKRLLFFAVLIASGLLSFSQSKYSPVLTWQEKLNKEYCSGLFNTPEATYFDLLNDNSSVSGHLNILDWLQGRVSGLQVYTLSNNNRIAYIRNSRAAIYVNEMLTDAGYLAALPVSDIAMIKVIKGPFAKGLGGPGGVIAIYTIRGNEEEEDAENDTK